MPNSPARVQRHVVRIARRGDRGHADVAADFDISVESVQPWVRQADADDGVMDGQISSEQNELVQLRRNKRRLQMENEILRRARPISLPAAPRSDLVAGP